jgi:signal transduction histidine kinase
VGEPLRTVLVVDDNAENRALARATLEDEGFRVVLADGGEAAVAAFAREAPTCILLDVRMPGVDGVEACRRIRALPGGRRVAIVFVTAQRDVDTFDRAIAAEGDDFVTKPYRPAELLVRVRTAMRLRESAEAHDELSEQIKRQRDDLQRLQLQREQLIAFLVHDLKNPVHSIDLHAQLVARDAAASDRSRRAAHKIGEETRARSRIDKNLRDIAKADEGRLQPARCAIDPRALIDEVIAELAVRAADAQVALAAAVQATALRADPDLLHRVVANLVDNAIRHAPEGSEIRVAATPTVGGVELRVADTGPGVPRELRETVFDRFHSSGAARSNRGLGLAFCKAAVEAHGGRIWIEDGSPGAVFCVRIADAD